MSWDDFPCELGARRGARSRPAGLRKMLGVDDPDLVVMHLCDDLRCANPKHLRVATQSDNIRDAAAKGRLRGSIHGKGEAHRFAKLTDRDIHRIRRLAAEGVTHKAIADAFGMNPGAVTRIVNRRRWAHVPDEEG